MSFTYFAAFAPPIALFFAVSTPLVGCGSSASSALALDGGATDAMQIADTTTLSDTSLPDSPATDGGVDAPSACTRAPAPADRARKVVVSHPFEGDAGAKATVFEVLDLAADGSLTRPTVPVTFRMGTALDRAIVYTPDGEIGLVAQDDGSVGVFRLSAGKAPAVIHAAFKGSFSAQDVIMAPDGTHAYVLDPNTANNGGGVYDVGIGCDGTLTTRGLLLAGSANALALLPADPTKAVLGGIAGDSPLGQDAHIIDLAAKMRIGSAAPFPDGGALATSVAVTPDGKYALIADNGLNAGNRVAVVALAPQISGVSVLPTPFPAAIVMSPFGNAAIVLNDDSTNQIHVLTYDPAKTTAPFAITGELVYKFGKPQLPTNASMLTRGTLKGRVFVAENLAVRQLTFGATGGVTDTAKLVFPDTIETIVGVVGVQP